MTETQLTNGKKVLIRKLSRPEIKECRKYVKVRNFPDGSHLLEGVHESQDAWIDKGLGGLEDWKAKNGEVVPDDIIMQLTDEEQIELAILIKEAQVINPTKPLSSD